MKGILKEGDPEKISRVEEQILEIWDRVYQSWVSGHFVGPAVGPQVDSGAVQDSWESFVNDVTFTPGTVIATGSKHKIVSVNGDDADACVADGRQLQ